MNDGEVRDLVEGFRSNDLPLSAVHLDIHYMDDYRVFTVNRERFSDLPALSKEMADEGVKLVAILDPGVKVDGDYPLFRDGAHRKAFCETADGRTVQAPVWPGWCAFPDFTSSEVRKWWGEQYAKVVEWGVSGVWHDMNEPAAFAAWGEPTLPRCTRHDFDSRGGDHREAHNLYALLEARAAHEALQKLRPGQRPWILSRSGWAGLQRYAWTWTGDSESNWWSLKQSIRFALSLGMVGIPYNGPDIGGFGGSPSPELFARWFQMAAFLPFFRTHCAVFAPRREPWVFGEPTTSIIRGALKLRYRLLPYFYTLAWAASQKGAPLVRPLFWLDESDSSLRSVDDQFLLGDALLVAPVVQQGAKTRRVVLPKGRWARFSISDFRFSISPGEEVVRGMGGRDEVLEGPGEVEVPVTMEEVPVFVREGSVIPMREEGKVVLHAWPGRDGEVRARGTLYSDSGDGFDEGRVDTLEVVRTLSGWELKRSSSGPETAGPQELPLVVHGPTDEGS